MCNLNILIRKDPSIERRNVLAFLQSVSGHSFALNSDGEGFYSDGKLVKDVFKINYLRYRDILLDSKMIITHQRFSTSGYSEKYIQPLMSDEFVLVHNGVMDDFVRGSGSDSWGFFRDFTSEFKKSNIKDREKRIVSVIKDLIENTKGYCSYSIAILDRASSSLYYFKNHLTEIHFYISDKMLYITTNEDNKNLLELFDDQWFEELEIHNNWIYRIDENLNVVGIAKIKEGDFKDKYFSGFLKGFYGY